MVGGLCKRERGSLDASDRSEEATYMQLTVLCGAARSEMDCLMVASSLKGLLSRLSCDES